ncbi:unnamed protein product [Phytophthora fragariaefolia]|uniref:ATP-dependent DNA helicase n=1 Tax=Phytophthora fragariaefolia TaxID=1490495 RepID=A0A9W6U939_9STRA|nr:unnamed protein product [Phytophthora fragariaefolia]
MGGRTAHSTFKIPLKLTNKSICAIYKQSHLKSLIQRASLVIWDEAPMTHRHSFEAVDRTLRDIVVHDVWTTTRNNLEGSTSNSFTSRKTCVSDRPVPRGLKKIIDVMYADINDPDIATDDYFANWTFLTTTNTVVHRINEAVSKRLSGDSHVYLSIDKVDDDNEENFFEQEVLHSININGIPPQKLTLKKGAPIMMMRNLNRDLGLCNGTRLRIIELKPHVIHATIMTGERQGQHVLIPRIVFISDSDTREFPFCLCRKQFPVVPAFAMTINKAQGQTVHNLGLYLATPCFSHGQLYVALSRVTSWSKFKALIEYPELEEDDGVYTDNIVYRQNFDTNQGGEGPNPACFILTNT